MQLAVIGTGYVGLVAGAGFSDFGNDVHCVDIDAQRIDLLKNGQIPIFEPGLEEVIARNAKAGRLTFSTDTQAAVAGADVVFIAVGTPKAEDGSADLQYVLAAAKSVAKGLTGRTIVVTKSTVPVGTASKVKSVLSEHTHHEFAVASNPEFLKEGDALRDFMKPSRVILGCDEEWAVDVLRNLYDGFVRTNDRIQIMDPHSAELTKYAANAMLATRISFMNELSLLCEKVGADIEKVRKGVGSDPRIGPKFLFPGPGFGGSCFPKDLRALLRTAEANSVDLFVTKAAEQTNERQKHVLFGKLSEHFGDLSGKKIGVWGLAFKAKTDDIRESPALVLVKELIRAGATVAAFDPEAMKTTREQLGEKISYCEGMYQAAEGADALVLVTEWPVFRRPNFKKLKGIMKSPVLFDGRNIWNAEELRTKGFSYQGIGRPEAPIKPKTRNGTNGKISLVPPLVRQSGRSLNRGSSL